MIEAMKQALDFFESGNFVYPTKIATDLRQAIAELESQEPVGYVAENGVVDWNVCAPPILTDLYTTPPAQPPQRTWVGLTDEDCRGMSAGDRLVAMWADRTLKEKNT
jgi:hypothetical protein